MSRRGWQPLRTCVTCRTIRPKREFVRVVRAHDGSARVDPIGSAPGRGAYVCPTRSCVEGAGKRLGGKLKISGDLGHVLKDWTEQGWRSGYTS